MARRKQNGGANGRGRRKVKKTLMKINRGLRKTKLISKSAKALSSLGVPYAGTVGNVAGQLGYGNNYRKPGGVRDKYGAYVQSGGCNKKMCRF